MEADSRFDKVATPDLAKQIAALLAEQEAMSKVTDRFSELLRRGHTHTEAFTLISEALAEYVPAEKPEPTVDVRLPLQDVISFVDYNSEFELSGKGCMVNINTGKFSQFTTDEEAYVGVFKDTLHEMRLENESVSNEMELN